ncbi:MAG: NADP-dependent glyceraldehyde-3-phosphate dehydrogenase [Deltaproteobacteria bacterium]|nr:NADP-dependent glyceraldehyde-3-phosphate dehydrogenase [Deltaproteobacteria bacterium]
MSYFPLEDQIPAQYRPPSPLVMDHYLLNGELRAWSGPFKTAHSPLLRWRDGQLAPRELGQFPLMGEPEALTALEAAQQAYRHGRGDWPTMPVEQRLEHFAAFGRRLVERRDQVVNLIMWEIAKSLSAAQKEFDRTVAYIRDTVEALKALDRTSSRFVIEEGIFGMIRRAPLGVVLCMGPFNYPLNETFTTLIPALIMGNTVVFKPPKAGIMLYQPLLEAFRDSFPPGVVNTLLGRGSTVTGPLMTSGGIDALAFIGSSRVATQLKQQHPRPHRLRSVLGLEAKNPAIILPHADLELTIQECVLGSLSFNGQRCTALKTIFVHQSLAERFLAGFSQAVEELKAGMPWDEGVSITPLPEEGKTEYLAGLVQDAVDHGARVINPTGGRVEGTLFKPAILYPVTSAMRVFHEEQFGPVIPVVPFTDLEEPINYVVNSNYGQQLSLFGRDPDDMARLIDPLVNQVCRLNLNCQCQRGPDTFPFTGRKDSAEGTLSVSDALRVFTIRTLVAAKGSPLNKELLNRIVHGRKSKFLSTDFIL